MTLPARLRLWPTAEQLALMARHPAAYAPTADEVLTPPPVPLPTITMTADERRLMGAIIADPDADEPRLRYADWVEASDPERAKFIRGQLATPARKVGGFSHPTSPLEGEAGEGAARTGRGDCCGSPPPSRPDLTVGSTSPSRGEVGVSGFHSHDPNALCIASRLIAPFLPFGARDVVFRRGFAEAMSLTGRAFVSTCDGLFAATPLRDVRLIAVNFLMPQLAACPHLRRLTRLDLRGNRIGDEGAAVLAGSPHLSGLKELNLPDNDLTETGVAALAAADWSGGVRVVLN